MTILARFLLIVPQFSRAHFSVDPYNTYDLADYYPEPLFNQRINEIQTTTKSSYPVTYSDYLAFFAVVLSSFILGFVTVSGYPKYFGFICFAAPISVWTWAIWQKFTYRPKVKKFENNIHALLASYTNSDLATYSISWFLLSTDEPHNGPHSPPRGPVYYYIHILLRDLESAPEDPLPLYVPQNENEKPPDYGLPEYERKTVRMNQSIDLGEAPYISVAGLCAEDVQRILASAPGKVGLTKGDVTDTGSEQSSSQIEGTITQEEDIVEVVIEGDRP